jgi:hypothetical protein
MCRHTAARYDSAFIQRPQQHMAHAAYRVIHQRNRNKAPSETRHHDTPTCRLCHMAGAVKSKQCTSHSCKHLGSSRPAQGHC